MTAGFRASVAFRDLPDALQLARPPVIAVVVPGPVVAAVDVAGARRFTARRGGGDTALPGAADLAGPVVAAELQWADAATLDAVVDLARALADRRLAGGPMFVAWRVGAAHPALAELLLVAAEAGSVIEVLPDTVDSLVAAGHARDAAAELVAATGGLPHLVAAVERGHAVDGEIAARLDLLAEPTRRTAEVIAFAGRSAGCADRDLAPLVVDGLVTASGTMPELVARAIRVACAADRRLMIADVIAATGTPDEHLALALRLAELGESSLVAARWYLDAAIACRGERAVALAAAAGRAGADAAACRRIAAAGMLDDGRPDDALREIAGLATAEDERLRARAWVALGDPQAAGLAFVAGGEHAWAAVVAGGCGTAEHDDGSPAALAGIALDRWRAGRFAGADEVLAPLATAARRQQALGADRDPVLVADVAVRVAERLGEHAEAAAVAAATLVALAPTDPHRPHAELAAGWIEARRGMVDHLDPAVDGPGVTPRARLVRDAARCAVAVRDVEGGGLDVALAAATHAAASVAPDLLDLDLRTDIAAAVERARADHVGDPLLPVASIAERGAAHHRFDAAWSRLQAALAGDRLDRIADRASALLALDPSHDRHRHAADIRVLARSVAAPGCVAPAEVIDGARRLAAAGAPHAAARWCAIVAIATTDDTTARLLLRESRAWRASRTRLRRSSGAADAVVRLSEQEERIGRLVLEGRTHKEIGAALFVSPKTVEHHVAHIRTKLGAGSRAELLGALRDYLD